MNIGDVEVTVGTEEQVDKKNNITDYPVEDGSVVSDNSERQPLMINISGIKKCDVWFTTAKYNHSSGLKSKRCRNRQV